MKRVSLLISAVVLGALVAQPAFAQWKWRDKNGVVQYSDLPPPPGIPAQDVIQQSKSGRQGITPAAPVAIARR